MTRAGNRRPQDHWGHRAKKEGFAARSVYKIEEIDRRVRLFRPGARVLDLGAFPGSWTEYAAQKVGPQGRVLGLDLQEGRRALPAWAELRKQDVMAPDLDVLIGASSWDVVMSDMAPATSGNRFVDQTRSFQLVMRAIEIAERTLAPAGGFVAKIFQGPDFEEARRALVRQFDEVRIIKPPASRTESIETFLVALRFTPATTRG